MGGVEEEREGKKKRKGKKKKTTTKVEKGAKGEQISLFPIMTSFLVEQNPLIG